MSDDLVGWLRAQLDEDEAVAQLAPPGPWHIETARGEYPQVIGNPEATLVAQAFEGPEYPPDTAEHIARWDPARVLREVEAKRRRIDHLTAVAADGVNYAFEARELAHELLEIEAAPYSDRPGYQEAWRP